MHDQNINTYGDTGNSCSGECLFTIGSVLLLGDDNEVMLAVASYWLHVAIGVPIGELVCCDGDDSVYIS